MCRCGRDLVVRLAIRCRMLTWANTRRTRQLFPVNPTSRSGEPETGMVTGVCSRASPTSQRCPRCDSEVMFRTVLVVDDDASFRELAARILTGWGHEVVGQAGTVAQALEFAASLTPDLALVDYGLPDGDGVSLTRQLRAMTYPPRVVLISSDCDRATIAETHRAGAEGFFLKDDIYSAPFRECVEGATRT